MLDHGDSFLGRASRIVPVADPRLPLLAKDLQVERKAIRIRPPGTDAAGTPMRFTQAVSLYGPAFEAQGTASSYNICTVLVRA